PGEIETLSHEKSELSEEAALAVDGDQSVLPAVVLDDRHGPRLDDEEARALLALGEEDLTGLDLPNASERSEALELVVVEARKGTQPVSIRRLLMALPYHQRLVGHLPQFA